MIFMRLPYTPMPSVRTFSARDTIIDDVLSLAIGVPVRPLNCLPQALHKYFWIKL